MCPQIFIAVIYNLVSIFSFWFPNQNLSRFQFDPLSIKECNFCKIMITCIVWCRHLWIILPGRDIICLNLWIVCSQICPIGSHTRLVKLHAENWNSGLSSARQIGAGVCAKIEIIATAAKIPAMTATAMMIFLFINVLFLTFQPLYLLFVIVAKRIYHPFMPASARNFLSDWMPWVKNSPSRNRA